MHPDIYIELASISTTYTTINWRNNKLYYFHAVDTWTEHNKVGSFYGLKVGSKKLFMSF